MENFKQNPPRSPNPNWIYGTAEDVGNKILKLMTFIKILSDSYNGENVKTVQLMTLSKSGHV